MKVICPNCKKKTPFTFGMMMTDRGVCPNCGKEIDMSKCTQLVVIRIVMALLIGVLVYSTFAQPLETVLPDVVPRIAALVVIALVPIVIVLYFLAPTLYNKVYVNKSQIKTKNRRLGR